MLCLGAIKVWISKNTGGGREARPRMARPRKQVVRNTDRSVGDALLVHCRSMTYDSLSTVVVAQPNNFTTYKISANPLHKCPI